MLRELFKPIHVIVASAVVVGLILFAVLNGLYEKAYPVVIKKVPSDVKIFVNDKEIIGNRTNLANGTYTVKAEKDGFISKTSTEIITDDAKFIAISLVPSSDTAKKWASDNQQQYLELEKFVGSESENSGKTLATKNPIVTELPIQGPTYTIGYILDSKDTSSTSIILTIDAVEGYRNTAIRTLYDDGYNPAEYALSFKNLTNPFKDDTK